MYFPVISIIIPTYNRFHIVERAIKSVIKQTIKNFEIIVVDDCSTDNTAHIINEIKKIDTRVRYIDPAEPVNVIPPTEIVTPNIPVDTPVITVPSGPTPTEEQITIGGTGRNINEKVPVTTTKEVERRKPGMQKVCTNWEWVERGSGQGERRSDAGPRPTVTKTKTKTRMRRI